MLPDRHQPHCFVVAELDIHVSLQEYACAVIVLCLWSQSFSDAFRSYCPEHSPRLLSFFPFLLSFPSDGHGDHDRGGLEHRGSSLRGLELQERPPGDGGPSVLWGEPN